MAIQIVKDPSRRMGGSALIRLPGEAKGSVHVSVMSEEGAVSLGPYGWQGAAHQFGPYAVENGPRGPFLRIGPEIVDQVDAFASVELRLPELKIAEQITWPDDILPSPDGYSGGGVHVAASETAKDLVETNSRPGAAEPERPAVERVTGNTSEPDRPGEIATGSSQTHPPEPIRPEPSPQRSSRTVLLMAAGLAGLAILAAAVWFFLDRELTETSSVVTPAPAGNPCTRDQLEPLLRATSPPGAADLWKLVDACREKDDRNLEAGIMDRLAAMGDAKALLQFGKWYDPGEDAPSPLGKSAYQAARYYKRAADAGASEAGAKLAEACKRLRDSADPQDATGVSQFCQ